MVCCCWPTAAMPPKIFALIKAAMTDRPLHSHVLSLCWGPNHDSRTGWPPASVTRWTMTPRPSGWNSGKPESCDEFSREEFAWGSRDKSKSVFSGTFLLDWGAGSPLFRRLQLTQPPVTRSAIIVTLRAALV
jgi:hypothetical protein